MLEVGIEEVEDQRSSESLRSSSASTLNSLPLADVVDMDVLDLKTDTELYHSYLAMDTRHTSFDKRQEEYLAMRETVRLANDSTEHAMIQWRKLKDELHLLRATSCLVTDDSNEMMHRRITEVTGMCSSTSRAEFFIRTLRPEVQVEVRKFTDMSPDEFRQFRRVGWTTIDYLRYALRMARVLCRAFVIRRKFNAHDDMLELNADASVNRIMSDRDLAVCSTGTMLRDVLLTNPIYRTDADRHKILRYLRSTKAFSHLFSSEMEEECTRYISYEKYQDGRVIAYQNRKPDKFFYVISGKIEMIKDYHLRAGNIQRSFGFINKGETSDMEVMEQQKPRKFRLVSVGISELLVLDKYSFFMLIQGNSGKPFQILRNISIFQEFPCEIFEQYPEAAITRYFPKDKVILHDISDTPWLHVIKTGVAYVVRLQHLSVQSKNPYLHQRNAGFALPRSHSDAMLGLADRQRKVKAKSQSKLPQINLKSSLIQSCSDITNGNKLRNSSENNRFITETDLRHKTAEQKLQSSSLDSMTKYLTPHKQSYARTLLGDHKEDESQRMFKTEREAYVVLDILHPGDVIALQEFSFKENISNASKNSASNKYCCLSLISGGTEIILVNKRVFMQHAANNTMLKMQTIIKEYASFDEVKTRLQTKMSWDMYKDAVLRKTLKNQALKIQRQ